MADRAQSWHYEDPNPVITKPIQSAVVIEVGDLVEQISAGNVTPASAHTWNTDLATTQNEFQDKFLGVAQERSRNGDTAPIRVNTSGVHEFDCAASTWNLGDLVGPAKQTGNALENQKVAAVASEALAIGRVAKYYGSNTTKVLVRIFSTIMEGGPQAKI
jgi:hypothetical protein